LLPALHIDWDTHYTESIFSFYPFTISTILISMKAQSLAKTNPFLTTQAESESQVLTSVSSSTAIETGEQVKAVAAKLTRHRSAKRFAVKLA
jgi:hypothetical protein